MMIVVVMMIMVVVGGGYGMCSSLLPRPPSHPASLRPLQSNKYSLMFGFGGIAFLLFFKYAPQLLLWKFPQVSKPPDR